MTQGELNKIFSRPDSEIELKYANFIMFIYLVPFLSAIMPLTMVLIFIFVLFQRFIDKVLFIRRYKAPRNDGKMLAYLMLTHSKYLPLVHILARMMLYGSVLLHPEQLSTISSIVEYLIQLAMLLLCTVPYRLADKFFREKVPFKVFHSRLDYYYKSKKAARTTDLSVML